MSAFAFRLGRWIPALSLRGSTLVYPPFIYFYFRPIWTHISTVDHPAFSYIDPHMADAGGIISSGEEYQIAGFDIGRGYRSADVAKPLRAQSAHIPAGMVDDPTDKARTVK